MKRSIEAVIALTAVGLLTLGGCPTPVSDGGADSGQRQPEATKSSIPPGIYIGDLSVSGVVRVNGELVDSNFGTQRLIANINDDGFLVIEGRILTQGFTYSENIGEAQFDYEVKSVQASANRMLVELRGIYREQSPIYGSLEAPMTDTIVVTLLPNGSLQYNEEWNVVAQSNDVRISQVVISEGYLYP